MKVELVSERSCGLFKILMCHSSECTGENNGSRLPNWLVGTDLQAQCL